LVTPAEDSDPPLKLAALIDDDGIDSGDTFYRLISPEFVKNRSTEMGPPSQAFQDYSKERARREGYPDACMSGALGSLLDSMTDLLGSNVGYGIARIPVSDLRALQLVNDADAPHGVMRAPETDRPWHVVVFRMAGGPRGKGEQKALARAAAWELYPS
jgi:hypothetical protein